ncbi:MAG: hypothetical protein WEB19_00495 [Acidimicrobiia bacterium]
MSTFDDQAVLDSLGAALRVDASPSPQEVEDLYALVTQSDPPAAVIPLSAPRRPPRMLRVAAVAAAMILGTIGLAALAGTSMPGSLREPARALGFRVDSQEMADARAAVADLRDALVLGDNRRISGASDLVRVRLRALSADELRQLTPTANSLLRQADDRLRTRVPETAETATKSSEDGQPGPTGHGGASKEEAWAAESTAPSSAGVAPPPAASPTHSAEGSDDEHESEHEPEPPEAESPKHED